MSVFSCWSSRCSGVREGGRASSRILLGGSGRRCGFVEYLFMIGMGRWTRFSICSFSSLEFHESRRGKHRLRGTGHTLREVPIPFEVAPCTVMRRFLTHHLSQQYLSDAFEKQRALPFVGFSVERELISLTPFRKSWYTDASFQPLCSFHKPVFEACESFPRIMMSVPPEVYVRKFRSAYVFRSWLVTQKGGLKCLEESILP